MAEERVTRLIRIVHVSWVDSETIAEWHGLGDLSHELGEIQTVGMLIHQDKECYLIASTYDGTTDSINAAIYIPRECVRTVRPLGTVKIKE